MTESDSDVVVVEDDDPFFEDSKNNGKKISEKLAAEVLSFYLFSFPLLTLQSPAILAAYMA